MEDGSPFLALSIFHLPITDTLELLMFCKGRLKWSATGDPSPWYRGSHCSHTLNIGVHRNGLQTYDQFRQYATCDIAGT